MDTQTHTQFAFHHRRVLLSSSQLFVMSTVERGGELSSRPCMRCPPDRRHTPSSYQPRKKKTQVLILFFTTAHCRGCPLGYVRLLIRLLMSHCRIQKILSPVQHCSPLNEIIFLSTT